MHKQLDPLPCEGRVLAVVHSPSDLEVDAPGLAVVLVQREHTHSPFVVWGTATGRGYSGGNYCETLAEGWEMFTHRAERHMDPHLSRDRKAQLGALLLDDEEARS